MGAMENAGCVTLRDEYLPRSRQDALVLRVPRSVILHEMAHMWFGDLVTMKWWDDLWLNESFAEWACYHAAVEATEFTESWTGFTNARKNWALPPGPAALDPPDRRRQLRPAGGRGQLRRHHLRQGRLGAQAAGRLGRARAASSSGCAATSRTTPTRNSEFIDLLTALEKASGPRARRRGRKEWLQTARRQHAGAGVRARRRRHLRVVRGPPDRRGRLPDAAPAPARHRPLRRGRRPPGPAYRRSRPTSRAS